jgi:7-cyano-7-deazaguanine reductase
MMSTMAVMGASWEMGETGWRRFYSMASGGKRPPGVTAAVRLAKSSATEKLMSKSPRKTATSSPLQLGRAVAWPETPDAAKLDRVPNPQADTNYLVRFTAPEFTSLCPVTGQPDFAHLMIDYVPGAWLLESKSLKLYIASFRNHGAFHEDCTVAIGKRIAQEIKPKWLRIGGYWYPRGGIPIDVFWQTGKLPKGMWVPEQGVAPYRGRG